MGIRKGPDPACKAGLRAELDLQTLPSALSLCLAHQGGISLQVRKPSLLAGCVFCLPRTAKGDELISRTQGVAQNRSSQLLLKLGS